jgi:hypothetical protein
MSSLRGPYAEVSTATTATATSAAAISAADVDVDDVDLESGMAGIEQVDKPCNTNDGYDRCNGSDEDRDGDGDRGQPGAESASVSLVHSPEEENKHVPVPSEETSQNDPSGEFAAYYAAAIAAAADMESGARSSFRGGAKPAGQMCPICMDNIAPDDAFRSTCGHEFCRECAVGYVTSNVNDGNTELGCAYIIVKAPTFKTCNAKFSDKTVMNLLKDNKKVEQKFLRFNFFKNNLNGRECPACGHFQTGGEGIESSTDAGATQNNEMVCDACQNTYCFIHGGAHANKTCDEYEAGIAHETQATDDLLSSNSKKCPGCGIYVSKTSGCNHMKVSNTYK